MGVVNTAYTFDPTDVITSAKMNNIIDETTFTGTAVLGTTLEVSSGRLKIASAGITSNEFSPGAVNANALASNAVTTVKIADSTGSSDGVTTSKLATDAVTTAKILDANVTTAKIADANITAAKLNGAQTGTAPVYGVRAWAHFSDNGTLLSSGGNVASVTNPSTGKYTVTFNTAMPNALYAAIITPGGTYANEGARYACEVVTRSVNGFSFAVSRATDGSSSGDVANMSSPGSIIVVG